MLLFKYLILLVSGVLVESNSSITSPTFVWGTKLLHTPNVFQVVSSRQFANMLGPLQKEHMIIVYFAPTLSVKDFSCLTEDCYPFLHEVTPSIFFSRVQEPWNALQTISVINDQPVNWKSTNEMLSLPCESRIYALNFSNLEASEHDHLMSTVAQKLSSCPVIYVYTAYGSPTQELRFPRSHGLMLKTSRKKKPEVKPFTVLRHAQGIIALERIIFAQEVRRGQNLYYKRTQVNIESDNTNMVFTLNDANNIAKGLTIAITTSMGEMKINVWPIVGNWRIASINFANKSYRPRDLLFYSRKYSFCCNVLSVFSSKGARLTLYAFYMDVSMLKEYSPLDPDYIPKQCWFCEEYLTPGINQVMFTMLILIILLSVGLYTILNMGRSLRFAHPNDPDMYTKTDG